MGAVVRTGYLGGRAGELAAEYEKLKVGKEEAETDTIFEVTQRRGIQTEKKIAKEQKDEADRFDRKRAELSDLRRVG